MVKDKFSAVWLSHSSLSDWIACPRSYYLRNVYKDPKTGRKLSLMSPPLSTGQAVHEVIESLSVLPVARRFLKPLNDKLEESWKKISGERGGFADKEEEFSYKSKAQNMLHRVETHPGPLTKLAVKINMDLPWYWFSEPDNLILCGMLDWLEYLPDTKSIHIIDFKSGNTEEKDDSLQLPIYFLLATKTQERPVTKVSYWYVNRNNEPTAKSLPDPVKAEATILKLGKEMKLARQLNRFVCPRGGCKHCLPFEAILESKATLVGVDDIGKDMYILKTNDRHQRSEIL